MYTSNDSNIYNCVANILRGFKMVEVCQHHHDLVKSVQNTEDMVKFLYNQEAERKRKKELKQERHSRAISFIITTLISLIGVGLAAATTYAALK